MRHSVFLWYLIMEVALNQGILAEETVCDDYYISLVVTNKVNHKVRIIPSRGKKGGYIVSEGPSTLILQVFTGTKEPIKFTAQDVATESTLKINNKTTPISLDPIPIKKVDGGDNEIIITAPATSVQPQHYWSMATLTEGQVPGNPPLQAHGSYSYVDRGVNFNGINTYMVAELPMQDSLIDPKTGLSIVAVIRFGRTAMNYQVPMFVLDSGGHYGNMRGVSLYVDKGKMYAEVQNKEKLWKVSDVFVTESWFHLTITWHPDHGLKLYNHVLLRAADEDGGPSVNATISNLDENLIVGRNIANTGEWKYAMFDMDFLITFGEELNESDINKVYVSF